MNGILVKRGRVIHLGARVNTTIDSMLETLVISVCNRNWFDKDKTRMGDLTEVNCKRCAKYVKEALENDGVITIKPKKKRLREE